MTRLDEMVLTALSFYDSDEGHKFWLMNIDVRGLDWESNVINMVLKAAPPENVDELEVVAWRFQDILIERGIVRIAA
jgi:hypothetical protein